MLFIELIGGPKLRWLNRLVASARNSNRTCSVTWNVFAALRFQRLKAGPRKVFRPRLPPFGTVNSSGSRFVPSGVVTTPVPSTGVENERQLPVTGSRRIVPVGL